ncbi:MAG: protoheme IX farnesyltransferase [Planctomycetes bacterium]|nr:protoheme IX farnesyltransferase [Planctomycetota bacterium]
MSGEVIVLNAPPAPTWRIRLRDLAALTKPRLNGLVLMAAAAGFFLGAPGAVEPWLLLHALIGILLVASGSSILNQVRERDFDARMTRTEQRPLAAGRLGPRTALCLGLSISIFGSAYLYLTTNTVCAGLAVLTWVLYLFLYTPLKRITPLNTLVGAFPGALPPLIGWAAAGKLDGAAGTLFAIVFLWQMPHFFAIAWLYRADYARGGFKMLPVVEPDGKSTGLRAALYSFGLIPVACMPTAFGLTGLGYAAGAGLLSILFFAAAVNFAVRRSDRAARQLFLASVIYLPLLLGLMFWDPFPHGF